MRNRARVVIIQDGQAVLIKRIREDCTYYVFPGGGIEEGETPEQAAEREALEELGITIQVTGLLHKIDYDGLQFFFTANVLEGTFGTGTGTEFTNPDRNRGTYEPMWISVTQLASLNLWPAEIATILTAEWS